MKWTFLVAIGSILGLSLAAWATPKLSVSELVYDFGEVKEGILVKHTFLLTNVGDSTLTFTRQPSSTCGCTTSSLPKLTLEPEEAVALEVRFESSGYGGYRVVRYVTVYSDDPSAPEVRLAVQGYVVPKAPFEESAYILRYRYRVILDVRDRGAFAQAHLLGAVNVPVEEIEEAFPSLPLAPLYVCDEAGERGLEVVAKLRQKGFWGSRALAGGLAGWAKEFGNYLVVGEPPEAEPQSTPSGVPPAQLAREYLIILDLRPDEAFAQGHLLGAIHVGPTGLDAVLPYLLPAASLAPELQPFIFCLDEGEGIAQEAAQFLQNLGLARAYALVGGLEQWRIRYGTEFMASSAP